MKGRQERLLTVIAPTLNEEGTIANLLRRLVTERGLEIIVADGGSTDDTLSIIETFPVRLVKSSGGRARQLNAAASLASGDVLLFLHADCIPPTGFPSLVFSALERPKVVGGAFRHRIHASELRLKFICALVNFRCQVFKMPYGDQGIFVRRVTFFNLKGFQEMPVLEDLDFVRRLKKTGEIRMLDDEILVSARRWRTEGCLYTTVRNQFLILSYYLGIDPVELKRMYPHIR